MFRNRKLIFRNKNLMFQGIENHILDNQIQVSKVQKDDYGKMTNVSRMDFKGEDGFDLASPPPSPSKCNLDPPPLPPPNYLIPIDLVA